MITENGKKYFGFLSGMPYGIITDDRETMENMIHRNQLPKEHVVKHMESLDFDICSESNHDYYTGEEIIAALCHDGKFVFPHDTIKDYKDGFIGIPTEYEEYLADIL